jgi:hypothetical protein
MTAMNPSTQRSGSSGRVARIELASDRGRAVPASMTLAVNPEFEGRAFVISPEDELGSTGTLHCGDVSIAAGSARQLASVAKRMR